MSEIQRPPVPSRNVDVLPVTLKVRCQKIGRAALLQVTKSCEDIIQTEVDKTIPT